MSRHEALSVEDCIEIIRQRIDSMKREVKSNNGRMDGWASEHDKINAMCAEVVGRELPILERVAAVCELAKSAKCP